MSKKSAKTKEKSTGTKVIGHIYAWYEDGGGDTHLFFDGDKVIHSLNASDSPFNVHEFQPLFDHLGVKIEDLKKLTSKQKAAMKEYDENLEVG